MYLKLQRGIWWNQFPKTKESRGMRDEAKGRTGPDLPTIPVCLLEWRYKKYISSRNDRGGVMGDVATHVVGRRDNDRLFAQGHSR